MKDQLIERMDASPSGIIFHVLLYAMALCFVVTDNHDKHGNLRRLRFRTISCMLLLIGEQLFQLSHGYAVGSGNVQILFNHLVRALKAT